jgi:hypothetical protein
MNKKLLSGIVAGVVAIILIIIIIDFSSNRPDRRSRNPYEYNVDTFRKVDEALVHYRETTNIPLDSYRAGALDVADGKLWIAGEGFLMALSEKGNVLINKRISGEATCIEASGDLVFVGFEEHIEKFSASGELLERWESPGERCVFTSLAIKDSFLLAADAGNRRVIRYDLAGNIVGQFEGKAEENALGHGFIIPSANFDLVVNAYDELWVVNPGMHAVENYSDNGSLRGYWQKRSMQIDGFTGCCNPAEIDVLADGSFVTSEKGLVRIKVYDASGELMSVVAPPDKFEEEGKAPEVKVDEQGRIWALDFDRNMLRLFERKNNPNE